MQTMIQIQAKTVGKKRPLVPNWAIPVPDDLSESSTRLKDLITLVVQQEVTAFEARQAERRFIRVLTDTQISAAAATGKVDVAAHEIDEQLGLTQATETALLAFEDGFYYVFVDDVQVESLDAVVPLQPDSQVTFLRLTPLAGG